MTERVEAEGRRFKMLRLRRGIAPVLNRLATAVVILTAILGIASIFVPYVLSVWAVRTTLFGVVIAYVLFLGAAFTTPRNVHRFRYVTYQSAAFIVLALSLRAFSLHDVVSEMALSTFGMTQHNEPAEQVKEKGSRAAEAVAPTRRAEPMDPKSVGELASVMILFILAEIAAFVAQDVDQARAQVKKAGDEVKQLSVEMRSEAENIGASVQLAQSVAQLHPPVMVEAIKIAQLWAKRAPNLGKRIPTLAQQCWSILLQTYLQEEQHDFWPKNRKDPLEGVPRCVRPVSGNVPSEHISYFATNVSFYVKYLRNLVDELQTKKAENQKICIAVVTNVLPAHWWNWPFAPNEWRAYTPMEDLRIEMEKIAMGGAQVDRVIAVTAKENGGAAPPASIERVAATSPAPNELGLWPEELLHEMLAWKILIPDKPPVTLSCSAGFRAAQGEIGTIALDAFPAALRNAAISKVNDARIYPMTERSTSTTKYKTNNQTWRSEPLRKEYRKLHGKSGHYWPLRVKEGLADDLDGHFDVMFIGLGPEATGNNSGGVWAPNDVTWGICLMNSYDARVETMFLSVMSDDSADKEYRWWQRKLAQLVDWDTSELLDAADQPTTGGPPPVTEGPLGPEPLLPIQPHEGGGGRSGPSESTPG